MPNNENPALQKGRASRVSFADWTPEALTLSAYRAQYLASKFGVRTELAIMLGAVLFGEAGRG